MTLRIVTIDDKIAAIEKAINAARLVHRSPGSVAQQTYEALKEIGKDLRARQELPQNNTLGQLGRLLERMKNAPRNGRFYDTGHLVAVANFVIGKWPMISQALERFGEESAE